ncbi:MAG: hypothetical protein K8T20_01920 [Planctomycetes bacterium]|nr:hypothetical protein [Planctomycetota bacterium]
MPPAPLPDGFLSAKIPRLDANLVNAYFRLMDKFSGKAQQASDSDPVLFPASRKSELRAKLAADPPHAESASFLQAQLIANSVEYKVLAEAAWKQASEREPALAEEWKKMCRLKFGSADAFCVGSMMLAVLSAKRPKSRKPTGKRRGKSAE